MKLTKEEIEQLMHARVLLGSYGKLKHGENFYNIENEESNKIFNINLTISKIIKNQLDLIDEL